MQTFKPGEKVHFCRKQDSTFFQNGIVKVVRMTEKDTRYFVVFNCGGDWENYADYTGCLTAVNDMKRGWR